MKVWVSCSMIVLITITASHTNSFSVKLAVKVNSFSVVWPAVIYQLVHCTPPALYLVISVIRRWRCMRIILIAFLDITDLNIRGRLQITFNMLNIDYKGDKVGKGWECWMDFKYEGRNMIYNNPWSRVKL